MKRLLNVGSGLLEKLRMKFWRKRCAFGMEDGSKNQEISATAFLCLTMVHVDIKGIIDGLWKGEMKCIGPKAKDADLWIAIWEELHKLRPEEILIEVEHVKAHRTEKARQRMSLLESLPLKVMRKRMR